MASYAKLMARAGFPIHVAPIPLLNQTRQKRRERRTIYASFFMPAIPSIGEEAEVRVVNLNSRREIDWVDDMAGNYAALKRHGLTSFFPAHP